MKEILESSIINTYPPILSLENIRVILRISKRKAAWMLQNGYIKCTIEDKKTKQYKVKVEDLLIYIDKVKNNSPEILIPKGLFSSQQSESKHEKNTIVPPAIIHQKPPEDFKDWLSDQWFDVNEMLFTKEVAKILGYNEVTVQRWMQRQSIKNKKYQNTVFTTKEWLIGFMVTEGYQIKQKSAQHTQLLLNYYIQ